MFIKILDRVSIQFTLLLNLSTVLNKCSCSKLDDHLLADKRMEAIFPEISPTGSPQPLLPLLAPSPLAPFTNTTVPKLSGTYFSHILFLEFI